jgi:hypothetical protein
VTATIQSVTENRFRPPLALASCGGGRRRPAGLPGTDR